MTSSSAPSRIPTWQRAFLQRHRLGVDFLEVALEWFAPLARTLLAHQTSADRTMLVALNGCQGSGKTTLAEYLSTSLHEEHGLNVVAISLDDFYLTRDERQALATSVHPLLATRGVPGTHNMSLLRETMEQLLDANRSEPVSIPGFNKATDDRRPRREWCSVSAPVQLVLLEGWCLGAASQSPDILSQPSNNLERDEDPDGRWRNYSNAVLQREFQPLYLLVDQWIMLRAPAFACVYDWRREQERKLAATLSPEQAGRLMHDDALRRFIQHYERLTRSCLEDLPRKVNHLFSLNHQRQIQSYRYRRQPGRLA